MRKIRLSILLFICIGLWVLHYFGGLHTISEKIFFPVFDRVNYGNDKYLQSDSHAIAPQMPIKTEKPSKDLALVESDLSRVDKIVKPEFGGNSDTDTLARLYSNLHGGKFNCQSASQGQVERGKGTKLYKWVDSKGKTHFGDKAPSNQAAQTIEYKGRLEYFDLIINAQASSLVAGFKDQLSTGITKSYEVLSGLLPSKMLKKVEVNVWLFDEETDYHVFRAQYAPGLTGKNVGFHNSFYNISGVHAINDASTMQTSIHESVHVIIGGVFGHIPRWLNEGLAEYLDSMNIYGQAVEIRPKAHWLRRVIHSRKSIEEIFAMSDKRWMQSSQEYLYARSWSLVYFLMRGTEERKLLRDFLIESAKNPCVKVDFSRFLNRHYANGLQHFVTQYDRWLGSEIVMHHY